MKGELRLGPKKTEYMARGFSTMLPIDGVGPCAVHEGLGVIIDVDLHLGPMMKHVERRGQESWAATLTAIEMLGLPLKAALAALQLRTTPKAVYGAELLIIRGDWQSRIDAMQVRWIRRLLDLPVPVPRVVLLQEVGGPWRLSTSVLRRALAAAARAEAAPDMTGVPAALRVAAEHETTWTAAVRAHCRELGVPTPAEWGRGAGAGAPPTSRQQRRTWARKYMRTMVDPTLQRAEAVWAQAEWAK